MPITVRSRYPLSRIAGFPLIGLICASLAISACSKGGTGATDQPPPASGAGRDGGGRAGGRGGRGAGGGSVPVVTAHVVSKAVPVTIPAVGAAEPLATVQIRAQVTGQLSAIHFTEGQDVRKGAPLFTLDARPFEAALQQAQAVLARDTAQAKNAQSQRARAEDLFNRGLIPRDQYETLTANASALESTLAADQAQIENARLNLQYTHILAPISGRSGALGVHQGDLVRANDTIPLVVINQIAPIFVTFSVPGRYLPDIRRYQARQPLRIEARIQAGGTPGAQQVAPPAPGTTPPGGTDGASMPAPDAAPITATTETGAVSFIDNSVDATTGTIKMKGTFANMDHALWPGLFVQVTLVLRTDPTAIVVPAAAVQTSQSGQFVFVVKPDRTVDVRNITVERQQGDDIVVAHGLAAGEEVVTDGQLRLTAGARVTTGTRGEGAGEPGTGGRGDAGGRRGTGGRRGGNRGN
jgi:multidrug efflux system membrane fusion protein